MTGTRDDTLIPELPKGIPNVITAAGFRVDQESIFVSGTISNCRHELDRSKAPTISFQELSLEARWNWVQKIVRVDLYFWLSLKLPAWYEAPEGCAASALQGSVSYESGESWTVSAEVRDLNLGMLYGFFPKGAQDTLFQLLKGIQIVDLSIFCQSRGKGEGTELQCEAKLMLGDVVSLGLGYECHPDGTWRFHASLGPNDNIIEPVTLGQIMDSLLDSSDTSLSSSLPDFLADTVILGGDPESNPKLELVVEHDETAGGPKLTLTASIMGIEVEFVQIKDVAKKEEEGEEEEKEDDNGGKPTPGKKPVKVLRLFKAVLTKIPMPKSDVTKDQLAALDKHIDMPSPPPTETSEPASAAGKAKQPAPGMTPGFHFVIIAKKKVVLDYPIGKARSDERKKKTGDAEEDGQTKVPDGAVTKPPRSPKESDKPGQGGDKPDQSSKSTYKNTVGPLSISQIGFRYEGGTLAILMDATIAFGPVALDLMGFTIGLHFQAADGSTKSLKSLSWQDVEVSISGVGVQFHREPLLIAGTFLHERKSDSDMYAGGLTVGFTPWLFQAAGFYGIIGASNDPNRFKCLFAYAVLRGPIMNIAGFAEISGLTGAFGYNVDLTLPTMDNMATFPLLAPPDEPLAPKDLVRTLIPGGDKPGPFFNPMNGAMFIAAGLTVTAFQMLEMTAVVAVQWSPRVQIVLMGLARCDVPSIKAPVKFAHIELGIIATVDLDAGILRVEAQLSPNSWIVHKSCHLTGGFALYYWFGGGRSDWVMTIGGYHSAFVVPEHYPRPDRLRISWAINSSLSVSGKAYFAITPKVCMGGLRIRAALSLGALSAWFDASADFLMTYKPFHFVADVKVSVGVRFSMDVWFVTVHIAVQVAASLSLTGPPLRGVVHVDFWVFGFDIAFGDPAGAAQPPHLTSEAFWNLVTQAEGQAAAVEAGQKKAHLFSCTKGLITENKQDIKAADPWLVRSGVFQFAVECQFAISKVNVNGKKAPAPETVAIDDIYAKPMRLRKPIDSTLNVEINGPGNTKSVGWKAKPAWKDVPQAIWGRYEESEDPNAARPGSDFSNLLNSGGGMARLLMGVIIEAPVPQASLDQMPAFRVDEAMKKNIYEDSGEPQFLDIEYEGNDFAPLPPAEKPWEALKLAWNDSPAPQSAVDLWQDIFNTMGLVKEKPTMLIDNNTSLFLSAPLLGKDWEESGKE
ncbi:hypothetical protein QQX98_007944 [Neonectria punicea]|uniref:DUF6603 domain-containing protein n=1 Tax=Neonectria punicea TaxID=979145 RepID=A0ABR1GWH9_9HYPO